MRRRLLAFYKVAKFDWKLAQFQQKHIISSNSEANLILFPTGSFSITDDGFKSLLYGKRAMLLRCENLFSIMRPDHI